MRDPVSCIDIGAVFSNPDFHRKVSVSEQEVVIMPGLKLSSRVLNQPFLVLPEEDDILLAADQLVLG